nr:reverse transcriptase, RNA-dependent DNA polymerase, Gag-polypeptide of LTR copia-type [Tanacetum cinerariifolium]
VNGERDHRKRLIQFLMGLDECYLNVRGQILLMLPMPSVSKVYIMIRQEEKRRKGFPTQYVTLTALSAQSNYLRSNQNNNTRGSDNCGSWKRSMMIALNAKNKLKIVLKDSPW